MPTITDRENYPLKGKTVLITGAARRIGQCLAVASAKAGADVVIHYNTSEIDAKKTAEMVNKAGAQAYLLQANLSNLDEAASLIHRAHDLCGQLFGLVHNASIFNPEKFNNTSLNLWNQNLSLHMTVPFLISQAFAEALSPDSTGRIVNMLDWRALRPGADHFAYTVSKAGLAAMTKSLAAALAPRIMVNGLALGAILPPKNQPASDDIIRNVPARKWGSLEDVQSAFLFLLTGPGYITGEIIHIDGGRHLI